MPRPRPELTSGSTDAARIPDPFVEAASLLIHLEATGVVAAAGERLRIRRQGGCPRLVEQPPADRRREVRRGAIGQPSASR